MQSGKCRYEGAARREGFNSLFIGIGFAIKNMRSGDIEETTCFNSLFIGIGFAILKKFEQYFAMVEFQFPFHRDRLCNLEFRNSHGAGGYLVSIPFSSG